MLPHRAGDRPYQRASRMFGCSLPDGQSVLSKELILLNDTSPRQTAHPLTDASQTVQRILVAHYLERNNLCIVHSRDGLVVSLR